MGDTPDRQVFINCPFSDDFRFMFEAIVFAVCDCGFRPRCALEANDGGEVRVDKICRIIRECRYGIHDLSMMDMDPSTGLARLNMSFELGLFLGARRFGPPRLRNKIALILDKERFRYQKSLSDIAGQDIRAHDLKAGRAIKHVRDWLQTNSNESDIPGDALITRRYYKFIYQLTDYCRELGLKTNDLTFVDLVKLIARWLRENA